MKADAAQGATSTTLTPPPTLPADADEIKAALARVRAMMPVNSEDQNTLTRGGKEGRGKGRGGKGRGKGHERKKKRASR